MAAKEIVVSARNGFPWQASIGAAVEEFEFVKDKQKAIVNGREIIGPINVIRRATLGEISFVDLGADGQTSARVAASASQFDKERSLMGESNNTKTQPAGDPQTSDSLKAEAANGKPEPTASATAVAEQPGPTAADIRAEAVAETNRIAKTRELCGGQFAEIEAQAIREGWEVDKVALTVLRAGRPKAPAADFRDSRSVLRFAFQPELEAGFSTVDIGGILSNVANKFLLDGFFSVERTWRNICATRNVSDFKTVTSYRLVGKDQYEQVAPGGELKDGTLGEESFANKADTYGLVLSIDRRDIINAEVAFMDQVDVDGKPIGIMPSVMLVPTALSAIGSHLYQSMELRDTTSSTKYPVANPHQGKGHRRSDCVRGGRRLRRAGADRVARLSDASGTPGARRPSDLAAAWRPDPRDRRQPDLRLRSDGPRQGAPLALLGPVPQDPTNPHEASRYGGRATAQ